MIKAKQDRFLQTLRKQRNRDYFQSKRNIPQKSYQVDLPLLISCLEQGDSQQALELIEIFNCEIYNEEDLQINQEIQKIIDIYDCYIKEEAIVQALLEFLVHFQIQNNEHFFIDVFDCYLANNQIRFLCLIAISQQMHLIQINQQTVGKIISIVQAQRQQNNELFKVAHYVLAIYIQNQTNDPFNLITYFLEHLSNTQHSETLIDSLFSIWHLINQKEFLTLDNQLVINITNNLYKQELNPVIQGLADKIISQIILKNMSSIEILEHLKKNFITQDLIKKLISILYPLREKFQKFMIEFGIVHYIFYFQCYEVLSFELIKSLIDSKSIFQLSKQGLFDIFQATLVSKEQEIILFSLQIIDEMLEIDFNFTLKKLQQKQIIQIIDILQDHPFSEIHQSSINILESI